MFPVVVRSPSPSVKNSAGRPSRRPATIAATAPRTAPVGPQLEGGKTRGAVSATGGVARLLSMSPAVSQVSRTTRTRLRILRRLAFLGVFLVVAMLALSQFTGLKQLATGVLASTALIVAVVGFAAQRTLAN